MPDMISETISVERENRYLVFHETNQYANDENWGLITLVPDAVERLQEYLNREFPIRSNPEVKR